jgi:cytochrome d ubiquinol oxidase subunit II
MRYDNVLLIIVWAALTAYALLGGADFGAGVWDLLAGGRTSGARRRALIEHAIGPVWEANHVWLIFVLVLMWTDFPALYAAIASTLYLPLTLIALGIIARGAAFAFRKAIEVPWAQQCFGAAFAFSSVITPYTLGAIAGGIATGRVPPGLARGNAITSWINPTSAVTGAFAVVACAYVAACYLAADARRDGDDALVAYFRRRAIASATIAGVLSIAGLAVLRLDAPALYTGLTGHALPLVTLAALAGVASLLLAWRRHYGWLRVAAATAVAAVIWAWGVAQFPYALPATMTVRAAAAPHATLVATTVCTAVGMVVLIPSLVLLFRLFQRPEPGPPRPPVLP